MPWRSGGDTYAFEGLSDQTLQQLLVDARGQLSDATLDARENGFLLRFIERLQEELRARSESQLANRTGMASTEEAPDIVRQ